MTRKATSLYRSLLEKTQAIRIYSSISALLHWDQETYMPEGAIKARSEQTALLSHLIHEKKTSPAYKAVLGGLIHLSSGTPKLKNLSKIQKIALREWHKEFVRTNKLPSSFVKAFSQLTSEAAQVWAVAKKENNFKLFAPFLEKIISMNRKKADILGFGDHPYDALVETYEPCMTSAKISRIFEKLQQELLALMKGIAKAKAPDTSFLHQPVHDEKQRELGAWIASAMPIEPDILRLDLSSHPFCSTIHPHDNRITTRYIPKAFMSSIFSILHEMGHAMYEMGLPTQYIDTPLCQATSLSIHESQSRWWETLIGHSRPFWKYFYPGLKKKLPAILSDVSFAQFYRAIHCVKPSFIRVESDEVSYCLHVILRFEIEKELIAGTLAVADLPDAWNAKFQSLFGMTPRTDAEGCLQDIHWSFGAFGYFPTYALGNLFAAQLFSAFTKKHRNWTSRLEQGDLSFIRMWLKEQIHRWGKIYDYDELAKRATGSIISETAYCQYLKEKYTEIYKLDRK